jgi:hypothetical protein
MADQYNDDEDDLDYDDQPQADQNGPANLRKALKRAEREKKELADQLATIQADLRGRSVKEVLEQKGVPTKVAKFIPGDVSTPEQIDAWLNENADVFGFAAPEDAPSEEPTPNARETQRINATLQNANTPSRDADAAAKLAGVKTREELDMLVFGQKVTGRGR